MKGADEKEAGAKGARESAEAEERTGKSRRRKWKADRNCGKGEAYENEM